MLNLIREKGFAALFVTVLVLTVMLGVGISLTVLTLGEHKIFRNITKSSQAYYVAEAGIEDALLRFFDDTKNLPASFPYTIPVIIDGDVATSSINIDDQPGYKKFIDAQGNIKERIRKIRAIVRVEAAGVSFYYGAQVGEGGLVMRDAATVHGNVFSNGDIQGYNKPIITGVAIAATSAYIAGDAIGSPIIIGGTARARKIEYASTTGASYTSGTLKDSVVGGDAYSDVITGGEIFGDAYYYTSISGCIVHGITSTSSPPSDIGPEDFTISDSKIEEWKQEASSAEIIQADDPRCVEGVYEPPDGTVLGLVKIECDLMIKDTNEITITGFIWVEGNLTVQNQGVVKLDSSFGELSSAVIVDYPIDRQNKGLVIVQDGAEIQGSGSEGSYLMVISQNNSVELGGGVTAINIKNSSVSSIFYAPHGKIMIENNITLTEATAYAIELKNSAELIYEIGLASLLFSSGPGGSWEVEEWEEIE